MSTSTCPACDASLEAGAKHCPTCGGSEHTDDGATATATALTPATYHSPPTTATGSPVTRAIAIAGIVFAITSFMFAAYVFGPLGMLFGHLARKRGERTLGEIAMAASFFAILLANLVRALLL